MSYQSKFTGEEIDSLLSNINNISNNFLSKTLFSGEGLVNTTVSLTDSVENYDFLLVEAWIIAPKEDDTLAAVTSKFISLEQHKHDGTKGIYGTIGVPLSLEFNRDNNTGTWGSLRALIKNAEVSIGSFITGNSTNYQSILKKITGIKFIQSSQKSILNASNPTGSILPVMGTEAPQDYLICDGSELNIAEYEELANYFEKQFGSKNHFGGDGINTFAIPDLRNEFLRGYGELSGEVGEHQDATQHAKLFAYNDSQIIMDYTGTNFDVSYKDSDTRITDPTIRKWLSVNGTNQTVSNPNYEQHYAYTSRPTNVAVLFCIKYTENNTVSTKEKDYFHAYIEDNDGMSANASILINPSAGWVFDYNRGFEYDDAGNVLLKANKTYEVSFNIERAKFSGSIGTLDLVLTIEDTQLIITSLSVLDDSVWGQSGGGTRVITPKQDCYFTIKSTQWTGQNILYIANISIREI